MAYRLQRSLRQHKNGETEAISAIFLRQKDTLPSPTCSVCVTFDLPRSTRITSRFDPAWGMRPSSAIIFLSVISDDCGSLKVHAGDKNL